jgi:hypothetical protein
LPGADRAAFAAAYADMVAGCAFLLARATHGRVAAPASVIAVRRAANCLRELDRFLVVMIDACNAGQTVPQGTRAVYTRETDAAGRLRRAGPLRAAFAQDIVRLRAIGRIRALANGEYPAEAGCRPHSDLVCATGALGGTAQHSASALRLDDHALAAIARYYQALADRLQALIPGTARIA